MKNTNTYQLEAALENGLICESMLKPEEMLTEYDKDYANRYGLSFEDMVAFKRDMEEEAIREEHEEEMKYQKELRELYATPQSSVYFAW